MKPTVYLAGPITGLAYDVATDWRARAKSALHGFDTLSPMRNKGPGIREPDCRQIFERDYGDVRRSDALLVNLVGATSISLGTCVELGMAAALRKHIVLAMEPGGVHSHPFTAGITPFRAYSLDEAVDILYDLFAVAR